MRAKLHTCMRKLLGACMRILGACLWSVWLQSMRLLGASIWKLLGACMRTLPHSSRVNQSHGMWDDAATDATGPAGSTPEGELNGKPCSINSDALSAPF